MRRMWIASVLMFGVGIGCIAATVAQNFVVPPVRAGTNPTKWEATCIEVKGMSVAAAVRDVTAKATQLGSEGWELAIATGNAICFKRPLS